MRLALRSLYMSDSGHDVTMTRQLSRRDRQSSSRESLTPIQALGQRGPEAKSPRREDRFASLDHRNTSTTGWWMVLRGQARRDTCTASRGHERTDAHLGNQAVPVDNKIRATHNLLVPASRPGPRRHGHGAPAAR